jgi:hypothetical protein
VVERLKRMSNTGEIPRHDGSGKTWETDKTFVMPKIAGDEEVGYYAETIHPSVWSTQVGGNHYAKYAIQPTEYIIKNKLDFCEGNVVKYVTRYKDKNGIEDLRKARHYLDILISEMEKNGS